jgi:hypothetical protein
MVAGAIAGDRIVPGYNPSENFVKEQQCYESIGSDEKSHLVNDYLLPKCGKRPRIYAREWIAPLLSVFCQVQKNL